MFRPSNFSLGGKLKKRKFDRGGYLQPVCLACLKTDVTVILNYKRFRSTVWRIPPILVVIHLNWCINSNDRIEFYFTSIVFWRYDLDDLPRIKWIAWDKRIHLTLRGMKTPYNICCSRLTCWMGLIQFALDPIIRKIYGRCKKGVGFSFKDGDQPTLRI